MSKIVLFANTDWYLYNFRRSLALALREAGHELLLLSPPGEYGARLRALGLLEARGKLGAVPSVPGVAGLYRFAIGVEQTEVEVEAIGLVPAEGAR